MSVLLERARLLLGQQRYAQAEQELGRLLLEDAHNATAHALLAIALLGQDKYEAASEHAAEAIRNNPDNALAHGAGAQVWLGRNYLKQAEEAARAAIALNPFESNWQSMLARVLFRAERWPEALVAAEAALELDPHDVDALNLQAAALRQLGRSGDARGSLHDALAQNPHEAWTHANLGWTALQQGKQDEAEQHFREALRLDPDLEVARQGIVEAIKAKNRFYRLILQGFFWLSRRTTAGRWYLIVGAYVGYRVALSLAQDHPQWGLILWPLVGLYVAGVVISWFATPLSNLCLRLHPLGRLALSPDERKASNWVGGTLGLGIVFLGVKLATGNFVALLLAGMSAALAIPLAMTFSCSEPGARCWMVRYTFGVAAVGSVAVAVFVTDFLPNSALVVLFNNKPANVTAAYHLAFRCFEIFLWGCGLSVWAVNIAKSVAWKK